MRDYGKVFSRIWESADFRALTEDGRALALYLLTCQHGTIAGVFRVPDGYACEDLQWSSERVCQGFANLQENGFATRCEATKWVWVSKFLEWNPPENPNQRKSAIKIAQSVPDQCGWKSEFMRVSGPSLGLEPPASHPAANDPIQTLGEGLANPSLTSNSSSSSSNTDTSPAKLPTCPSSELVALYHEVLPELPAVRLMNDKRKRALAKFWTWVLTTSTPEGARRATGRDEALAWFRRYLERARDNDFLMGRSPRNGDHAGWECDLDFLLTDKGMKHVIEKTVVREAA
jgi:hypothetical protein